MVLVLGATACAADGGSRRQGPARTRSATLERARARFGEHRVRGAIVVLAAEPDGVRSGRSERIAVASGDDPAVRTVPASTFKIPNLLIGLDARAVAPGEIFRWDGEPREIGAWERDLTLVEAFRASCVPCFQEIARRVGLAQMRDQVRRLAYGNGDVGERVDRFWLDGPLAISVDEQVELVRRIGVGDVPFGREHLGLLRAAMEIEQTPEYRLFAKTGWARGFEPNVGWYVGWIETAAGRSFFATRVLVSEDRPEVMAAVRKHLTLEVLADLGLLREARSPAPASPGRSDERPR